MKATVADRLQHILTAIDNIQMLLRGRTIDALSEDPIVRAALERFVEIISEASRYIPADLKQRHPEIPWVDVAAIGNRIRHGYDQVSASYLWAIYENNLDDLAAAIRGMSSELP